MGGGSFNVQQYAHSAKNIANKNRESIFEQRKLLSAFNPLGVTVRESCASIEHSDPTSIIIACDVTGSMGKIPENLLKGGLGKVMENLLKIESISNPQVMFAAVGDADYDKAPLQVTQFESDNRIEAQLKDLYLEGGGGGNGSESYHMIWYFATYKTQLDSLKKDKKGILFTMGDEMMPSVLKADHIKRFIDKDYHGSDIPTSKLIESVKEKYEVFHLVVQDTETYKRLLPKNVNACWEQYLGERAILVSQYQEIPEKIVSTIRSLCELNTEIQNRIQERPELIEVKAEKEKNDTLDPELGKLILNPANTKSAFFSTSSIIASDTSKLLNRDSDNVPHLFICPISLTVMEDPVIAEDGFNYDRKNINTWFEKRNTSPKTGAMIGTHVISNNDLKSEIKWWQENQAKQANDLSASVLKM